MRGTSTNAVAATPLPQNRSNQRRRTYQVKHRRRHCHSNTHFRCANVEVGFYLNGRKPEDKDANGIPLQPDL